MPPRKARGQNLVHRQGGLGRFFCFPIWRGTFAFIHQNVQRRFAHEPAILNSSMFRAPDEQR
eukprot:764363-Hanusia_phi.AAC.3